MSSPLTAAQKRLSRAKERAKRAKLGPALNLTPADLDVLANVGPTDQAEAVALARAVGGSRAVDFMEAE